MAKSTGRVLGFKVFEQFTFSYDNTDCSKVLKRFFKWLHYLGRVKLVYAPRVMSLSGHISLQWSGSEGLSGTDGSSLLCGSVGVVIEGSFTGEGGSLKGFWG